MSQLTLEQAHQAPSEKNRFVVNLIVNDDRSLEVVNCSVSTGVFTNSRSFFQHVTPGDVFTAELARYIGSCVQKVSQAKEIMSLPSLVFQGENITLAKAHIISTVRADGKQGVMLRFRVVEGSSEFAYRPEHRAKFGGDTNASVLALAILDEIALPILNAQNAQDMGILKPNDIKKELLDGLAMKADEIKFEIDLIRDFIEGRVANKAERPARAKKSRCNSSR